MRNLRARFVGAPPTDEPLKDAGPTLYPRLLAPRGAHYPESAPALLQHYLPDEARADQHSGRRHLLFDYCTLTTQVPIDAWIGEVSHSTRLQHTKNRSGRGGIGRKGHVVHIAEATKGFDIRVMGMCRQGVSEEDDRLDVARCNE